MSLAEELREWMDESGNDSVRTAASALGVSGTSVHTALGGGAGRVASRRIRERLRMVCGGGALGQAMELRIASALTMAGHEVSMVAKGGSGPDFVVDGVPVFVKVGSAADGGRQFLEVLARAAKDQPNA